MDRATRRILVTFGALMLAACAVPQADPTPSATNATSDGEADESAPRPNVLNIGASSLISPLGQPQLVGALFESKGIPMNVEGEFFGTEVLDRMLSSRKAWDDSSNVTAASAWSPFSGKKSLTILSTSVRISAVPSMANNAMTWSSAFGLVTHPPLQTRLPLSVTSVWTKPADPMRIVMPVARTAAFRDRVMAPRFDPMDVGQPVFAGSATPAFISSRPIFHRIKQSLSRSVHPTDARVIA